MTSSGRKRKISLTVTTVSSLESASLSVPSYVSRRRRLVVPALGTAVTPQSAD